MGSILGWLMAAGVSAGAGLIAIPRQLWLRWRERMVDRLDQGLLRTVSRFDHRYREFVLNRMRFVDLKGLATVGFYTPELDDVFVDVSLAYRAPYQVPEDIVDHPHAGSGDRLSLIELLDRPEPVVLAVIGVPGSGKSTLLRHTARVVCQERRHRRRTVPILLQLRDHTGTIVDTPEITLPALVRGTLGRFTEEEPPGWLDQRLRGGDCVVLLDGLDEVAQPSDRRSVADWVERQTSQYPGNDYVITSRPHGYRTAGIAGAVVLQVRGFSDRQVTHFVHAWYLAVERHGTSVSDDVRQKAESGAADLLDRLNGAPALYDLTVNPLLLTMIANVHRYRGALPAGRVDLYREICEVVLWRRNEAKNLPASLSGDKREAILRGLAFAMMRSRVRDLPRADALEAIRPALRRMTRDVTAEEFLAAESRDGLYVERENGVYSFAHHTFQEYLAAAHLRAKGMADLLCDWVDDLWWRETTLLYVARSDADAIVQSCLKSDSLTALSLAFDCANQCGELAPGLRDRLDGLLASALGPDANPDRRRLMVGVQLTRLLAPVVRTARNTRVCVNPITASIYRLYLQDIQSRQAMTRAGPDDPVTGVSSADAEDFIRWVNSTIGQAGYRLPIAAEITDPAVRRALGTSTHSAWLRSNGEARLWTPPGQPHPHRIEPATLADHLAQDFPGVAPTMARLLLLRSIVTAQSIAGDPDHDHGQARDLAYELGVAHRLAGPSPMHHDFPAAEDLAADLIHNLDRDHALARRSARDLRLILRRMEGLDRTHAHDRPLDQILALDTADTPAWAHALTEAMRPALETKPRPADWLSVVATAFASFTERAFITCDVAPETLPGLVHTACDRLDALDPQHQRFRHLATMPLDAAHTTAIRLGACCLADAVRVHDEELANLFHTIAAGVTLLERRASGATPPTETIILATA